jgi:hypothetical protein
MVKMQWKSFRALEQDAEKPASPVVPRSPAFLLADDEESRKALVSRERFLPFARNDNVHKGLSASC